MIDHPYICNTPEYYEFNPEEKQLHWFKKLNYIWFNMPEKRHLYFNPKDLRWQWFFIHKGVAPFYYHWTMFTSAVDVCASEE